MKKIILYLILCVASVQAVKANNGLIIPSTLHETETNASTPISQSGGYLNIENDLLDFETDEDMSIGFWIKLIDDRQNSAVSDGVIMYIDSSVSSGTDNFELYADQIPNNAGWHYIRIDLDLRNTTTGKTFYVYAYNDSGEKQLLRSGTGNFDPAGSGQDITFGAIAINFFGTNLSLGTLQSFAIDELVIFGEDGSEMDDEHSQIFNFGPNSIPTDHEDLKLHFSFDSESDVPYYLENVQINPNATSETDIVAQTYVNIAKTPVVQEVFLPIRKVFVTVESEYGADDVFPTVGGLQSFDINQSLEFSAPNYIYLDRFGNELGSSDEDTSQFIDQAFYRARVSSYEVNGTELNATAPFEVTLDATEEIIFKWQWEIEYAVIVEYEAGNTQVNAGDGNPLVNGVEVAFQNTIGKKWVSADTLVSAQVDSDVLIGDAGDTRFSATGYRLENFPRTSSANQNNFISFDGENGYLQNTNTGLNLTSTDFTIELWARRGEINGSTLITIGDTNNVNQTMRLGFSDDIDNESFRFFGGMGAFKTLQEIYNDTDWHHWAVVYSQAEGNLKIYRDGVVLDETESASINYVGNSSITIGAANNSGDVEEFFSGNLDNVRIWTEARSEDDINESMVTQSYNGAANLQLELTFDSDYSVSNNAITVASTEGINFDFLGYADMFPGDYTAAQIIAASFVEFENTFLETLGARVATDEFTIRDWLRIVYTWEKEFRITIAVADDQGGLGLFGEMPYLLGDVNLDGAGSFWIEENASLRFGSTYRTADRCYTLASLLGNTGIFENFGFNDTEDSTDENGDLSREFFIPAVNEAGTLIWSYSKTIFRALITLGDGLDVSSTAVLNTQITPDLCDGGELHLSNGTPEIINANLDLFAIQNGGTPGTLTQTVQWDEVGTQLLPIMPGEYTLEWQDANDSSITHIIHIATALPEETIDVSWELEEDSGLRLLSGDDFVTSYTFDGVSEAFPSSPSAHYRHIYSSVGEQRPPLELDPNSSDNWYYHGVGFSTASILTQDGDAGFTASTGGRTVLLYSYQQDATQVATGDAAKERFAVRIVESADIADVTYNDYDLSTENRGVFYSGDSAEYYAALDASSSSLRITEHQSRTVAFWVKLDESVSDGSARRIVYQIRSESSGGGAPTGDDPGDEVDPGGGVEDSIVQIGFLGPDDVSAPNQLFFEYDQDSLGGYFFSTTDLEFSADWQHFAIVTNGSSRETRIYHNGRLIVEESEAVEISHGGTYSHNWGASLVNNNRVLNGHLDDFKFINGVLDATEIRELMVNGYDGDKALNITFDLGFSGDALLQDGSESFNVRFYDLDSDSDVSASVAIQAQEADFYPEVATQIKTKLDTAGFDSGYLLNALSNYNPLVYTRTNDVGTWGPIFPVNWSGLYDNALNSLKAVYYENPFFHQAESAEQIHPNVAWPYVVLEYDEVEFPTFGEHKDKKIYISSRLGTEGVDANGTDQLVLDPVVYQNVSIYNQPDPILTGYNPNEEHAIIAPSIKDQLTGDTTFNLGQDAAFALQKDINVWGETDSFTSTTDNDDREFTSEPWVLVQYQDIETEQWLMAAYQVELTRDGAGAVFPVLDNETNLSTDSFGQPVPQPTDPSYAFEYPTFAGDIHIPPYPLNRVIGSVILDESWGGNIGFQRALWEDINGNTWTVSGEGQYFYRYWYPMRSDFWYEDPDSTFDGDNDISLGTPIAWLPRDNETFLEDGNPATVDGDEPAQPQTVLWNSYWRDSYPVLKRGESITYVGGEYFNENADAEGLPGVVGFAASQIIYDSANPLMEYNEYTQDLFTARVLRGLDRIEVDFEQSDLPIELTPAFTDNIMVDGARYYFKLLTGSLQKRVYFDSLRSKLVFRGRLNDLEGGDPDLTATPISLYVLEPNVMTQSEYESLLTMLDELGIGTGSTTLDDAFQTIYETSQNPHGVDIVETENIVDDNEQRFYAGYEPAQEVFEQPVTYIYDAQTGAVTIQDESNLVTELNDLIGGYTGVQGTLVESNLAEQAYQPIASLGTGSIIIPNPKLLHQELGDTEYITVAENNHPDATGAISLHIIQIGDERYRGAIKVIEAQDVFSEKINIKHTGDFGGNAEEMYCQWWIRNVDALDNVGLPAEESDSEDYDPEWQLYTQGTGLNTIAFEGRPDITLADKLFYVRYGYATEFLDITGQMNDVANGSVTDDSWNLVDINDNSATYNRPGADDLFDGFGSKVPFQWAGASNSPQLQSDGSLRYLPQLVLGWVKRVLDRVNPYEARFSDFYNNESPATYSSQIQIAGAPYVGNVALNSDKDVIENVGLIELYETVLDRARSLTLDIVGASDSGTNQAVLLASTRLAFLYELLAREAYTDAQDPTVTVTAGNGLTNVATYVHAFYNQQASLLEEELALLRGTDFLVAYPAYNRMFWNYVKGEGEAAYNATYDIYDVTEDGFINEFDAASLYPQGHGDAWGHFLSANSMHYELLQNTAFDWEARAELYSLLDNVFEVDYLDEGTFARIAAGKARTGLEVLRATYRKAYTENPDGQWQGYNDADAFRAWGVQEWGKRSGQAALFDWVIGNAILPEEAEVGSENLHRLDRKAAEVEIREIAGVLNMTQSEMDNVNSGFNPIGLDIDAMVFDIDPLLLEGGSNGRTTHFEQVYAKAVDAANNARAAFEFAASVDNQIRKIADDADGLRKEALFQDLDYRNQLISIFGSPYDGTIGPGQIYDEGYAGPDTLLYLYIDQVDVDDYVPSESDRYVTLTDTRIREARRGTNNISFDADFLLKNKLDGPDDQIRDIFDDFYLTAEYDETTLEFVAPVGTISDYAFQADAAWGSRVSTGSIQHTLLDYIQAEIEYEKSVSAYIALLDRVDIQFERMRSIIESQQILQDARDDAADLSLAALSVALVGEVGLSMFDYGAFITKESALATKESFPLVAGASTDGTSALRSLTLAANVGLQKKLRWGGLLTGTLPKYGGEISLAVITSALEKQEKLSEEMIELKNVVAEFSTTLTEEETLRTEIGLQIARLEALEKDITTTIAEGFRLLDEREAFNISIAASVQRNRYGDMIYRLARNDALRKYQDAFNHALKYAWLAAKAYDYETSLSTGSTSAATTVLEDLVKTRTLGLWTEGEPQIGQGGIGEILAQLNANFSTLEGQLGINNPQYETGKMSLRSEMARIRDNNDKSDKHWQQRLQTWRVDDLWDLDEYRLYCRPVADPSDGPQPGIVVEFNSEIIEGNNFFGMPLGGGDQAYSLSNFATKISSLGVWFEGYNDAALATAPRVYLVPVGNDVLRLADSDLPETRTWNVIEQRIPAPFSINDSNLNDVTYIPSIDSVNDSFASIRRFADFRAYHDSGSDHFDDSELETSSRLIGRSVWNTRWLLIIPGAYLHADADYGLDQFVDNVSDIKLLFKTYSHSGL